MPAFTGGTGVAYAVAQTEIGLAIETTKGTPVSPTYWFPVKSPKYKPDLTLIPDETLQGSMVSVYDLVRGMRYDSHGWDSNVYLDSFPLLVCAELGSSDTKTAAGSATTLSAAATAGATTVSLTATEAANTFIVIGAGATLETHYLTAVSGSGPYTATLSTPLVFNQSSGAAVTSLNTHSFSLLNNAGSGNQPPSVTITDYDGEEWRQLAAGQMDELSIKGNATGLVTYSTSWLANASITPSTPTPSYSSEQAAPGWTFAASIGGSIVDTVVDWEVDFKRGTKPIPALTGSQAYFEYFANTLQATGKLTFIEQSGSPYLASYLNGTKQALDLLMFDLSSGAALDIHCTNCMYKTGELDRSKEYVQVSVEFQMLPSSTDATAGGVSPVKVNIGNAVTTAYH